MRRSEWSTQQRDWLRDYFDREIEPVLTPGVAGPGAALPADPQQEPQFHCRPGGHARVRTPRATRDRPGAAILAAPHQAQPRPARRPEAAISCFCPPSSMPSSRNCSWAWTSRAATNSASRATATCTWMTKKSTTCCTRSKANCIASRYGAAVRLEIAHDCPPDLTRLPAGACSDWTRIDLYRVDGPVNLSTASWRSTSWRSDPT